MRKALTFLLIALIAVTSVFANGSSESSGKTEVYFLNFKPEIADVYTNVVEPAFEAAYPQYDLKVVTAASNQYQQTLMSELSKSAPPVIFQVNGPVGIQKTSTQSLRSRILTSTTSWQTRASHSALTAISLLFHMLLKATESSTTIQS